jgi:hypothetical protein
MSSANGNTATHSIPAAQEIIIAFFFFIRFGSDTPKLASAL